MGFQIVDKKVINISENSTGNDNIIYHTAPIVFEACFFPVRLIIKLKFPHINCQKVKEAIIKIISIFC